LPASSRIHFQIRDDVDADAFPNVIRDLLVKASLRLNVPLIFIANQPLRLKKPASVITGKK
jgi:uncharacterized protein YaiI (UPF0178 family)